LAQITFLGTADAFASGGRAHSAYWVDDRHGAYTVDFGPTALHQSKRLGRDPDELDAVLLTHLHGDHIGGLALLLIDLEFRAKRTRPLILAGPPGHQARVAALWDSTFPSLAAKGLSYPIVFETTAVPGDVKLLGRTVGAIRARHDKQAIATSLLVDDGERRLAFSGDTGWQPALAELVRGADAFVCECSGVEAGYWAHLSVEEIRANRPAIEVGRLFLSHLGEEARRVAVECASELDVIVADDGLIVTI
jgi:ribonuclease BN (tRNA processing enzyme)